MKTLFLDPTTVIRPLRVEDSVAAYELISNNHPHLDRWLRWSAALKTLDDVRSFLAGFEQKLEDGDGFHCGIWLHNQLVGGVVCWYMNRLNRNAEVGYWLAPEHTGVGLATRATEVVVDFLFAEVKLHRVEMQCGVENHRSRSIPERLGFRLEGIRRDSHWITDRFVDHAVYGILANEWMTRREDNRRS